MSELQKLMDDISYWSDLTFGSNQRNPAIVHHLKKEVDELIEAINQFEKIRYDDSVGIGEYGRKWDKLIDEYSDCFMLLFDSASRYNLSAESIIGMVRSKLNINKKRKWGKPDANGVVEHIRN